MSKVSVKETLQRKDKGVTYYWSRLPGKVVNKFSGSGTIKMPIEDPVQWAMTLLETLTDSANEIHRKSLRGSADFLVCNGIGYVSIKSITTYNSTKDEKQLAIGSAIDFSDARRMGTLNNRMAVYVSDSIPENQILVGRVGVGFEFKVRKPTTKDSIPEIDVNKSTKKFDQPGQIQYWNLVELLDTNLQGSNEQ